MTWLLALQLAMPSQVHSDEAAKAFALMDFARADREVEAALATNPYLLPALKIKADLALFAHRPEIARSALVAAVVGNPSSADAHLSLGIFQYTQGNFSSAVSPLEQAHSLALHDPKPLLYLGMCYEALAKTDKASSFYQQAEDLPSADSHATALILTAYGRLLSSLGNYKSSIVKEKEAVRLDSTSRSARYELASALALTHSWKEAAAAADQALTLPGSEIPDAQIQALIKSVSLHLKNDDDRSGPHHSKRAAISPLTNE